MLQTSLQAAIGIAEFLSELDFKTVAGKAVLKEHLKGLSKAEITAEHELIEALKPYHNGEILCQIEHGLSHIKDLNHTFKRCANGETLDLVELYEIKHFALESQAIKDLMAQLPVTIPLVMIDCTKVITKLSPKSGIPEAQFYLYDDYSPQLALVRQQKRQLEQKIAVTTDESIKQELLHERLKLVDEERKLEEVVRKNLSESLKVDMEDLMTATKQLGHLDFLIAKVKLIEHYRLVQPQITDEFSLEGMSHPVLEKTFAAPFTRNSLKLAYGVSVLTGANMGGKTTLIKTVAFNAFLANIGFYVSCFKAAIPLFDHIEILGLTKNLRHGLSAFAEELKAVDEMFTRIKGKSALVLVDEFAASTNPTEGQKFVKALCQYLAKQRSISLIATHYDEVGEPGMVHFQMKGLKKRPNEGLANLYDLMDYRLEEVKITEKVPKEALTIAKYLNINEEFLHYLSHCYEGVEDDKA